MPHLTNTTKRIEVEVLIHNTNRSRAPTLQEDYPDLTEEQLAEYREQEPFQLIERLEATVFFERRVGTEEVAKFIDEARALVGKYNGAIGATDLETGDIYLINSEMDTSDDET